MIFIFFLKSKCYGFSEEETEVLMEQITFDLVIKDSFVCMVMGGSKI